MVTVVIENQDRGFIRLDYGTLVAMHHVDFSWPLVADDAPQDWQKSISLCFCFQGVWITLVDQGTAVIQIAIADISREWNGTEYPTASPASEEGSPKFFS